MAETCAMDFFIPDFLFVFCSEQWKRLHSRMGHALWWWWVLEGLRGPLLSVLT